MRPWTQKHYGIDAVKCSRRDKEIIRPFLVFHGNVKRAQTLGRHWVDIANKKIKNLKLNDDEILVITDIRFDHYEQDEVFWLKQELKGLLVHISNYVKVEKNLSPHSPTIIKKGPANESEKANDYKLKAAADHCINWQFIQKPQEEVDQIFDRKIYKTFRKKMS